MLSGRKNLKLTFGKGKKTNIFVKEQYCLGCLNTLKGPLIHGCILWHIALLRIARTLEEKRFVDAVGMFILKFCQLRILYFTVAL